MSVWMLLLASVVVLVLAGWKTIRTHKKRQRHLIQALEEMDVHRQKWRQDWLERVQQSTAVGLEDLVQRVKIASASLLAATQTASQDWSWGDSTDVVLLYEWAFEKAVFNWVYAQKDENLSQQWQESLRQWNVRRQEMNLVASSFNASFEPLWSRTWMRALGRTMTTIWMDEMEHHRVQQRLRNSLAGL